MIKHLFQALLAMFAFTSTAFAVDVSVNWGQVKRAVDPLSYSVNASYGYQASRTGNAGYRNGIKYAIGKPQGGTALLRLHRQGLVGSWSRGGVWDPTTIVNGIKPLIDDGFTIMIDFDRAIGGGSNMDIAAPDAAALVKIINIDAKLGVKYWEIFNENQGDGTSRGNQVKGISQAMKAVDPTIKVGGTSLGNDELITNFFPAFVQAGQPYIDFVSFHNYMTGGSPNMPDVDVYNNTQKVGAYIRDLRTRLNTISPNKYIPIIWDEYNIHWQWTVMDDRIRTNKGGVLDALVMIATVDNGGDISNLWNECESTFGFMDCSGNEYTPAHVFHLFNQFCNGDQVAATTSNQNLIVSYAVRNSQTNAYSLVLVNRSPSQQTANVTCSGWTAPSSMKRHQVWTTNGIDSTMQTWTAGNNSLVLPDNSVTVLTASNPTSIALRPTSLSPAIRSGKVTLYTLQGNRLAAFPNAASAHCARRGSAGIVMAVPEGPSAGNRAMKVLAR